MLLLHDYHEKVSREGGLYYEIHAWDYVKHSQHKIYAYPKWNNKPIKNFKEKWHHIIEDLKNDYLLLCGYVDKRTGEQRDGDIPDKYIGNSEHNPRDTWINADLELYTIHKTNTRADRQVLHETMSLDRQ